MRSVTIHLMHAVCFLLAISNLPGVSEAQVVPGIGLMRLQVANDIKDPVWTWIPKGPKPMWE